LGSKRDGITIVYGTGALAAIGTKTGRMKTLKSDSFSTWSLLRKNPPDRSDKGTGEAGAATWGRNGGEKKDTLNRADHATKETVDRDRAQRN